MEHVERMQQMRNAFINLSRKAWREETLGRLRSEWEILLKHRLHALTLVTSESMQLFLLKTFSTEIQIVVTLLSIFESCSNTFTCPNELYMAGFITAFCIVQITEYIS